MGPRADRGRPSLVRACLRRDRPGPYQVQAAINAVHSDAATAEQTDWAQILALYDQLLALAPTPVVALNRAVAVGEVHGPQAALDLVDQLHLPAYHAFHATRADLLAASAASATPSPHTTPQPPSRPVLRNGTTSMHRQRAFGSGSDLSVLRTRPQRRGGRTGLSHDTGGTMTTLTNQITIAAPRGPCGRP